MVTSTTTDTWRKADEVSRDPEKMRRLASSSSRSFQLLRRHEPSQLLEPVLDDDDLRRGGRLGGRLDHEKTLAVSRHVIVSAAPRASGGVRLLEDPRRAARNIPRADASVDTNGHECAIGRHIEQLSAVLGPERPRAAGRRDPPLPRFHVGKRPYPDL